MKTVSLTAHYDGQHIQDEDYASSGLLDTSLIRLGSLGLMTRAQCLGSIGFIDQGRHLRLQRLADYLEATASRGPLPA